MLIPKPLEIECQTSFASTVNTFERHGPVISAHKKSLRIWITT